MARIIGITGTLGAGKGTIVEYLKKKGFVHFSVRGYLTSELEKRNMEVNRDNMVELANRIRAENSPSYIAEQMYEQASKTGKDIIIESLRTEGEVLSLRKKPGFVLLAIDADQRLRYERITERKSATDNVSFEKFIEDEKKEMGSTDPNKQNLRACIEMADYRIENSGTIEELNRKIDAILEELD
ncbi:AAA family ATPase [Candidatus Woesearchaeota archaeon]|nr:AAA family ATPase [Candidatus Woesearchaeota archaeon]